MKIIDSAGKWTLSNLVLTMLEEHKTITVLFQASSTFSDRVETAGDILTVYSVEALNSIKESFNEPEFVQEHYVKNRSLRLSLPSPV